MTYDDFCMQATSHLQAAECAASGCHGKFSGGPTLRLSRARAVSQSSMGWMGSRLANAI